METYRHLFGGSEDLQAVQLPDHDPAVYVVGDMFEVYGFFRYDDGWRFMSTSTATVDLQRLMSEADWDEWDFEIGTNGRVTLRLLEEAKAKPWPES